VVDLEPGPVERLALTAPAGELPADGVSEATLALEAVDRFGNRVDGTPQAWAELGQAGAERDGSGWRVRYRAPRLEGPGMDWVHYQLEPASGEIGLALAPRTAELDLSLWLGMAVRPGNGLGPEVGVAAVYWPRGLRGKAGFGLEATWSSLSRSDQVTSAGTTVTLESHADFVALEAVALLRYGLGPRLLGWAELGAGGALASTKLTQPSLPALGAASWVPLVHGALALGLRSGPFLEARAIWQGDARAEALQGSLMTFTLSAGWRLELF
jgi:hypothetical protein